MSLKYARRLSRIGFSSHVLTKQSSPEVSLLYQAGGRPFGPDHCPPAKLASTSYRRPPIRCYTTTAETMPSSSSSSRTLFTLKIPALPSPDSSSDKRDESAAKAKSEPGSITVTTPGSNIYILTFISAPDNRLTTPFIRTFLLALDILEHRHPRGVVITTSGIQKFYSNGFDLTHVFSTPGFVEREFFTLLKRCLTYPMPMVACMNGHAFAGGFMLATAQDYRLMNAQKGYCCLNEIKFGMPMEGAMVQLFKNKVPSPYTIRKLMLEGHQFPAGQALEASLIDGLVGKEDPTKMVNEAVEFVEKNELPKRSESGLWGIFKEDLHRESIAMFDSHEANNAWRHYIEGEKKRINKEAEDRVKAWETSGEGEASKSKL